MKPKKLFLFILLPLAALFLSPSGAAFGYILEPGTPIPVDDPNFAPLFPFPIPKTPSDNITNVQTWPGAAYREAGSDGRIRVKDGQFVNDRGPVRFVGTNMTGPCNLPASMEDAEFVAKSMARFGINIVRHHFLDTTWGMMKSGAGTLTVIDPDKLQKLDQLIYQFKKHGIYVNINLHVGRQMLEQDGLPNINQRPQMDKGLDNFEPKLIEYQKQYARELLTHVNPYTKMAYVDDPCVAAIEINNENSVVAAWRWGSLNTLPEPYNRTLQKYWNDWLIKKYGSSDKLASGWNTRTFPYSGNLIPADAFLPGNSRWSLVVGEQTRAQQHFTDDKTVLVEVAKKGITDWAPEINCSPFAIQKGTPYTLKLKMRSRKKTPITVNVSQAHASWANLGFYQRINLTDQWQEYSFSFVGNQTDDRARICIGGFIDNSELELAGVSLVSGGTFGLQPDETLEAGTVVVPWNSRSDGNVEAAGDFSDFLLDLEDRYWQTMYRYIKDDLKAQAPVSGTQLQYGSWHAQGRLDYCDIHSYWNHPSWTDKPWDGMNWYVNNSAMVNAIGQDKESGIKLAALRVRGLPFTVSEYNHPFPNQFQSEGLPILCALGAFQSWNVIYQYTWLHTNQYDPQQVTGYFDLAGNTVQLAHLPACWAMFSRGDVKQGGARFVFAPNLTQQKERELFRTGTSGYHRSIKDLGLDYSLPLAVTTGLTLPQTVSADRAGKAFEGEKNARAITGWADLPDQLGSPEKKWIRNETGEFYTNFEREGKGFFTVNTPRTKLFTGFIDGRTFSLGDWELKPGQTRLDHCTISIVQASLNRYLLTATGLMANTNEKLEDVGKGRITYRNNLGTAPVLCEGIPAELTWKSAPKGLKCFALDATGARQREVPIQYSADSATFRLDPKYQTVWYELTVE